MTKDEQIAQLSGEIEALTLYLRAVIDKHPNAEAVLKMAESEVLRAHVGYLNLPFPEEFLSGIESVQKKFSPRKK